MPSVELLRRIAPTLPDEVLKGFWEKILAEEHLGHNIAPVDLTRLKIVLSYALEVEAYIDGKWTKVSPPTLKNLANAHIITYYSQPCNTLFVWWRS